MKNRFFSPLGAVVIAALMSVAVSIHADPVTYYVDSSLSSLTLSGTILGYAYSGQGGNANALVDFWGGTITGDLTGGTLTLSGGSAITANVNALAPFSSSPYASTPNNDAYGLTASGDAGPPYGTVVVNAVYRNMTLDITAGTATDSAPPSGMTLAFTAGNLDYGAAPAALPSLQLYGGTVALNTLAAGANTSSGLVSLPATENWGDTLILPVIFQTTTGYTIDTWSGTLVAVIPEPSSIALALVGLGLFVARARARRF